MIKIIKLNQNIFILLDTKILKFKVIKISKNSFRCSNLNTRKNQEPFHEIKCKYDTVNIDWFFEKNDYTKKQIKNLQKEARPLKKQITKINYQIENLKCYLKNQTTLKDNSPDSSLNSPFIK